MGEFDEIRERDVYLVYGGHLYRGMAK